MNHFRKIERTFLSKTEFQTFGEDQLELGFKLEMVRQHGSQSLSFASAIQSGMCHFANRDGYLAYQKKYGHTFVLGDPVVPPDRCGLIIDQFLSQHSNVTFCQVSSRVAEELSQRKYLVNELGFDSRIDLNDYDFSGEEKEQFRDAEEWLCRNGFKVREFELTLDVMAQVKSISEQSINSRSVRKETAFLDRPLEFTFQPGVRRFFLLDTNDRIQAFVFFDPIYENGEVIGYVSALKRRHPDIPSHTELGIGKAAIEQFKSEGRRVVRLGLTPLAGVEDKQFRHSWLLKQLFRCYFHVGWVSRFFSNRRGHADFKECFGGVSEKAYFARPRRANDVRLFALMRLCRII